MQAILVQASKDTITIYLFREPYQSQIFILQAFIYQSLFIVYLCLSIVLLQVFQRFSLATQTELVPLTSRYQSGLVASAKDKNLITLDGNT